MYGRSRHHSRAFSAVKTRYKTAIDADSTIETLSRRPFPLALSAQNPLAFDIKRIEGEGNAGRELEITQSSIDSMFILGNHFIDQPVYEAHQAPILVEVVDFCYPVLRKNLKIVLGFSSKK